MLRTMKVIIDACWRLNDNDEVSSRIGSTGSRLDDLLLHVTLMISRFESLL